MTRYSFRGWWSHEEIEDSPEPWETFRVELRGIEAGDVASKPEVIEAILAASGKRIMIVDQKPSKEPTSLPDVVKLAFNYYKRRAGENGWKGADILTASRQRKIKTRLNDVNGLPGWCDVIDRIPKSRFLMGKVEGRDGRCFRMHLDFVLQESSFTKLREGFYDDPDSATAKFRPL